MAFFRGQKVVCVNPDGWWNGFREVDGPQHRKVYTIREIITDETGVGLRLEEIRLPAMPFSNGMTEPRFNIRRFRPVKTTDISCFTQMLAPSPKTRVRA